MVPIQLVYTKNNIFRRHGVFLQDVEFAIQVQNLSYRKTVTVHWSADDEQWHILPACYLFQADMDNERWLARLCIRHPFRRPFRGAIRFYLQYSVLGREFRDDNHNSYYFSLPNNEILMGAGIMFTQVSYCSLPLAAERLEIIVAAYRSLRLRRVSIRWTMDHWHTFQQTPCLFQRGRNLRYRRIHYAKPGNQLFSMWYCQIKLANVPGVEYAICGKTRQNEIWDNNYGRNYSVNRSGLKVLTLNLHCWQEQDQHKKFDEIVRAIKEQNIDIICFQEVGEEDNDGAGNWQSNAAKIIQDRLKEYGLHYQLYTDWSHIGFERYREGLAILSSYSFLQEKAAYISTTNDIHNIHARKALMVQINLSSDKVINIFSVHLSWWKEGFVQQFEKLQQWARKCESERVIATLLCGDFNIKAGSRGYMRVVDDGEYEDQFLKVHSPQIFTEIFEGNTPGREELLREDNRIDFIMGHKRNRLTPIDSKILFDGLNYRKVSDHPGYLTEFSTT